jgi:hypothetical protein
VLKEAKFRKHQGVVILKNLMIRSTRFFCLTFANIKVSNKNWMIWIKKTVAGGTLCVKVNDKVGAYFGSHKAVRPGDPFNPFLFNMVDNSLAKMVSVAQQNDLLLGLANNIIQKGVAMLQYADDTILLIHDNMEQARNLKLLLYIFEAMSGLKINFEEIEVMMIMQDD